MGEKTVRLWSQTGARVNRPSETIHSVTLLELEEGLEPVRVQNEELRTSSHTYSIQEGSDLQDGPSSSQRGTP